MESITGVVGILVTIFGGLAWLLITLGKLTGRLDTLDGKKIFERIGQAEQKLEELEKQILQKIETAQQQAVQQTEESLSGLKTALQDLEVAKQRALDEITQASSLEPLLAIEQQINQSVEEFRSKIAEVGNQADARRLALEQDAEQFLVKTQKQLVELEQQREKVTSEIAKVKSDALKELQQEVVKLKQLVMQPAELEQQREKVTSEIAKIKSDALKELQQEVMKLKQSVVQPADPLTDFAEILPEITFETAFIDDNKNIRRETRKARQLVETLPNNVKLEMIYVPGGTFMMGSNESDSEKPIHPVTLKPFFVGKYPVTQAQWEAIMGNNPSKFKGANRPVETVTWDDAMQCCAKLSQLTGQQYRLLSDAQWEYACRAGSVTKYSFGEIIMPALANYDASGIKQTTDVGKYPANAFGLYDMHGNIWEWCEDVWHGNYQGAPADGSAWMAGGDLNRHLIRGGSWYNYVNNLRCAYRYRIDTTLRNHKWGFRISRVNL